VALKTLREMAGTRRVKLGTFVVEFSSPGIGQILKAAGCEYVLLDMEHSGFGFDTLKTMLRYMQSAELPTIVRAPSRNYHHIARALDMGAEGIMLPMVGSAEEAKEIVAHVKYPPQGHRGVALQVAHDRYAYGPVLQKLRQANRRTTIFAQIETRAGVENVEKIAAVKGIDCLWVGHFDLSASLGIPGQFDHPDFIAAITRVARAGRKHKKALGRLVPDVATGTDYYKRGYDFICYSGDVWVFQSALKDGIDRLRAGAKRGGGRKAAGRGKARQKAAAE
jgi:2-keto-3-deoxy-L-rhamnonate aldolase RhmA